MYTTPFETTGLAHNVDEVPLGGVGTRHRQTGCTLAMLPVFIDVALGLNELCPVSCR